MKVKVFLRDDDLTKVTPQLQRLMTVVKKHKRCLIGAIPSMIDLSPLEAAACAEYFLIAQHGFLHENQSATGDRSEFPATRTVEAVALDLQAGQTRLRGIFGADAAMDFIPPWNRFDQQFDDVLPALGFRYVSTYNAATLSLRDGVPHVGYAMNYSSNYSGLYSVAAGDSGFKRLQEYAVRFCGVTATEMAYLPICLHHQMMQEHDFQQLDHLLELCQLEYGWEIVDADEAVTATIKLLSPASNTTDNSRYPNYEKF